MTLNRKFAQAFNGLCEFFILNLLCNKFLYLLSKYYKVALGFRKNIMLMCWMIMFIFLKIGQE